VFQLEVHEPTERRWPSQELHDGQQRPTCLECFWIPLQDAHVLQAGQGALIGSIFEE
jgi:demethoxyubiquinone hydroxylase (CLK1/Coq7/Cat5 family)